MDVDSVVFILSLVDCAFLLFLSVYFIITLSDLECDYINATQCCSRLNSWVLIEVVVQSGVTVLMFLTFHYIFFIVSGILSAWLVYQYVNKPSGNIGWYDPTEIHNRYQLRSYMKHSLAKLGYHLILFFFFLYNMIVALLS